MTITINHLPVFQDLSANAQTTLLATATPRTLAADAVLCYAGDAPDTLYVLTEGTLTATRSDRPPQTITAPALLDPLATLGGLPHTVKLEAHTACTLYGWSLDTLWQSDDFSAAARHYLAGELHTIQTRLDTLEQPVHYTNARAAISPGPFRFDDVTMIFAFCDADLSSLRATLPDGVKLLRRPGRKRDSVLIALADFPASYPVHEPVARLGYTETTVFVPVRFRHSVGLYVQYIYPSAYEPIVLGREIYGFPKQLGLTTFESQRVTLNVDRAPQLDLTWEALAGVEEARLVRALVEWLGLEGRSAALAFQAGDVLRKTMGLPPFRRVGVFNHKQILAVHATVDTPAYAVDQLTHTIFGVLTWYQLARMRDPQLDVRGGPLAALDLDLREAYRTQLDLRLSTGRIMRDYLAQAQRGRTTK